MLSAPAHRPDWDQIDSVLLDLDGTLLDLAFDNYVWMGRIPEIYAEARGLSVPEAQAELAPKFRALQGQLEWYCIDHWSRALDIDIAQLHRDESHRIGWLPGARGFLDRMRERGKRLVLLTNSHPVTLEIKHQRTGVLDWFDAAFSSQQFGAPKEDARFWVAAREAEPFDPARSVFCDDSAAVLHAARTAGVRWVYAVRKPDSSRRGHAHQEFTAVDAVSDLG
ncbi:MAG: GMP/IMP nucleotidase [Steroidobacteraceae bacterium]